jgi:hypothetical protein
MRECNCLSPSSSCVGWVFDDDDEGCGSREYIVLAGGAANGILDLDFSGEDIFLVGDERSAEVDPDGKSAFITDDTFDDGVIFRRGDADGKPGFALGGERNAAMMSCVLDDIVVLCGDKSFEGPAAADTDGISVVADSTVGAGALCSGADDKSEISIEIAVSSGAEGVPSALTFLTFIAVPVGKSSSVTSMATFGWSADLNCPASIRSFNSDSSFSQSLSGTAGNKVPLFASASAPSFPSSPLWPFT